MLPARLSLHPYPIGHKSGSPIGTIKDLRCLRLSGTWGLLLEIHWVVDLNWPLRVLILLLKRQIWIILCCVEVVLEVGRRHLLGGWEALSLVFARWLLKIRVSVLLKLVRGERHGVRVRLACGDHAKELSGACWVQNGGNLTQITYDCLKRMKTFLMLFLQISRCARQTEIMIASQN
jgi:hypothetical protein